MEAVNELKENYPIITVHGQSEIYIENFKTILELCNSYLKIKACKEIIIIEGKSLIIDYMNSDDIKVSGNIEHIRLVEAGL